MINVYKQLFKHNIVRFVSTNHKKTLTFHEYWLREYYKKNPPDDLTLIPTLTHNLEENNENKENKNL